MENFTLKFRVETKQEEKPYSIYFDGVIEAPSKELLIVKIRNMFTVIDTNKYNIFFPDCTYSVTEYDLIEFGLIKHVDNQFIPV